MRATPIAGGAVFAGIAVAVALVSGCASRDAGKARPEDGRQGFAIGHMAVREAVKAGDAAATIVMRCRCPVAGEYVVTVSYDTDLAGIDARFPELGRPFAGAVSGAMGVSLTATVADATSGKDLVPEAVAPTVFDAATKERRWSGERLAAFRLRGGGEYRVVVEIHGASAAWLSLDPLVLLDPSAETRKWLAWRKSLAWPVGL